MQQQQQQQQQQTIYEKKIMSQHPLTPEAEKYVSSMSVQQRQLHEIAIVSLASSYFVEKTHGFREYLKSLTGKKN